MRMAARHWKLRTLCKSLLVVTGCTMSVALTPSQVRAEELTLNKCLEIWQSSHSAQGQAIAAIIAEGPANTKVQLTKEKLNQVKAQIERMEKLKFRCRNFIAPPPGALHP